MFLTLGLTCAACVGVTLIIEPYWDWIAGCLAALTVLIAGSDAADRMHDPLPKGVRTFGDLAKAIANHAAAS